MPDFGKSNGTSLSKDWSEQEINSNFIRPIIRLANVMKPYLIKAKNDLFACINLGSCYDLRVYTGSR